MDQLGEVPFYPATNNVDPNLTMINCFLSLDDPLYWKKAKNRMDQMEPILMENCNKMALLKLKLLQGVYYWRVDKKEESTKVVMEAMDMAEFSDSRSSFDVLGITETSF